METFTLPLIGSRGSGSDGSDHAIKHIGSNSGWVEHANSDVRGGGSARGLPPDNADLWLATHPRLGPPLSASRSCHGTWVRLLRRGDRTRHGTSRPHADECPADDGG